MSEGTDPRAAIRATSAFAGISDEQVERLLTAATTINVDPGHALMVQGDPSEDAMLIIDGEAVVTADSAHGAIRLSRLTAPALVGEIGAFAKLARTATVRAETPVTALVFARPILVEIAGAIPSLLIDIVGRLGDRVPSREWLKFEGGVISSL